MLYYRMHLSDQFILFCVHKLGYIYVFDETYGWNMAVHINSIIASCSWLVCALVYSVVTVTWWWTQIDDMSVAEEGGIFFDEQAAENMMYADVVKGRKGDGYSVHEDTLTRSAADNSDYTYEGLSKTSVKHMSNHPSQYDSEIDV